MLKTEADIETNRKERVRAQENVQVIMHRLQTLDERISDLVCQCEEFRKTAFENKDRRPLCSQCGNEIETGQEAIVKNSVGIEIGRCHKECLHALLKWKS